MKSHYYSLAKALGVGGLYLFAISIFFSVAGANIGLAWMGIGFLLMLPFYGRDIGKDRYFIMGILFMGYVYLAAFVASTHWPELADKNFERALDWIRMGFLVAFITAFWLAHAPEHLPRVFILAAIGFVMRMARYFDLTLLPAYLSGAARANFGIFINPFALFAATLLLFFLMTPHRYRHLWQKLLWFLTILILIEAIIATQARQIWIICALVLPCFLFLRYGPVVYRFPRTSTIIGAIALTMIISLVAVNFNIFQKRFSEEQETITAIFSGDLDAVPPTSIGLRVYALRLGVERFLERPLFGFGPGMNHYLIDHGPYPDLQAMKIQHFHNAYLETLVALGLVGGLFFGWQLLFWYRGIGRGLQNSFIDVDLALFLKGALLLFLLANLFDFHLGNYWGRFYITLLGGACYAPRLAQLWLHKP